MLLSWLQQAFGSKQKRTKRASRRLLSLEPLEERSLLAAPVINAIANVTVPLDKSRIIPITASSSAPLTYTVTSNNANITAELHVGNPFLQITVAGFGTMTFELLRDVAPDTVDTITGLVQAGFYNGLTFHRVIDNFVIQGGDPLGTGFGGPGFSFPDEFNPDAIFSGTGQLAMANSGKDTNGSQFFITMGAQRHLDFQHTIFGQLVRGAGVLNAISNVATDANGKPLKSIVITSAKIVQNTTDAVITLKSSGTAVTNAKITVTVTGSNGSATKVFFASSKPDVWAFTSPSLGIQKGQPINDPPILGPVSDMLTPMNAQLTIPLTAFDIEDPTGVGLLFAAAVTSNPANASVTTSGNNIIVTPTNGYVGPVSLIVGVRESALTNPLNRFDTQRITIGVGDQPLTGTNVAIAANALMPLTNALVGTFTDADMASTAASFTATINWGDGHVTSGIVTQTSPGQYNVTGSNTYAHMGTYNVKVDVLDVGGATAHIISQATVTPTVAFALTESGALENSNIAQVKVVLSDALTDTVTVNYAVTGGSAVNGVNFQLADGTLTFSPGQTVKMIPITILNDLTSALPTDIQLTLSSPSAPVILGVNTVHTFNIVNGTITFATASSSGQEGASPAVLKLLLSGAFTYPVSVDYTVAGGTATNGADYTLVNGTATFNPGEKVVVIPVTIINDTLSENNETFKVTLSNPTNAILGTIQSTTYTIVDTDVQPVVSFSTISSTANEGVSATVAVSLSAASGKTITVKYAVTGGTAKGGGVDYTLANGTLTFNPGETIKNITIPLKDDTIFDPTETIKLSLVSAVNATRGSNNSHTLTINDTDAMPQVGFSVTAQSAKEGEVTTGQLTVTLSAASGATTTVAYRVTGGTAIGGGVDFTLNNGTLTFLPGETVKKIPITLVNDVISEANETVLVTLSNPTNATLGANVTQTFTIVDNDALPKLNFAVASAKANESETTVVLAVTLSGLSDQVVTVDYVATDISALSGVNYYLPNGTLTFSPHQTVAYITLTIINDSNTTFQENKTLQITLANPTNSVLGTRKTLTFTIVEDNF